MDLATGAMASLLLKLVELLKDEYNLQKGVKKDVEFLEKELRSMHAALLKVSEVPRDQLDKLVKIWANEVRELSYDMEDVVDGFLVCGEDSEPTANRNKLKQLIKKMGNLFKKGRSRHQIADVIKDIKNQVQEVADRRDRYTINDLVPSPAATTTVDPRMLAMYKDQKEIISIDVTRDEVIKKLTCGESKKQLMTISIFGFGGLGKTTLAKAVYDTIKKQFDLGGFVTVGRNPDVKEVFKDILFQLDKKKYTEFSGALTLSEMQLIDLLRGLLINKKYIIVIDDIWDTKAWEMIKCTLMDSECGSRIITTTRIFQVATRAGDLYKLEPLSQDRSEELFYKILFGGKEKCHYDQPAEVTKRILHKCGGVPLAIITIASLLVSKPVEEWCRVYNSIGFGYEDNEHVENTRKILLFSYYDLPCHLRTCLLHLSIFPEDATIMKDTLIWKWITEGFIMEKPEIGLFELGERYFNELINRSMIQSLRGGCAIYACQVHDLVLDMIYSFSEEENFATVLTSNKQHTSSQRKPRRLAIQKRVIDKDDPISSISMPQVRSFNAIMCHFSMMSLLAGFKVLRVLAIDGCTAFHLEHLGRLVHLRYLKISRMDITILPGGIENLKFLQTLILRRTKIRVLPQSVGLLKQLKCLQIDDRLITVPGWIGNLTSLEVLSWDHVSPQFVKELRKLTELRELRFEIEREDGCLIKDLMESLGYLKKLQILEISVHSRYHQDMSDWVNCNGYVPSRQLRHLKLELTLRNLPWWINPTVLPNLSTLNMSSCSLGKRDQETLGRFPELTDLGLMNTGPYIMGGSAFPKLRSLAIEYSVPTFLRGAMASLEALGLRISVVQWKKYGIDFDFNSLEKLPCLQRVFVFIITHGARVKHISELMVTLRHAVDSHPNRPILGTISMDGSFTVDEYDQTDQDEESCYEETEEQKADYEKFNERFPQLTRLASFATNEEDGKEHYARPRSLARRASCMF